MVFSRFPKEKLLHIIVNRTVIFFFLMCILALLLYTAGTVQAFTDSTQLYLLWLSGALGILLAITSICGIALDIIRFIRQKKGNYLLRAGGYFLLLIFAIATVFIVMTIIALSRAAGVDYYG